MQDANYRGVINGGCLLWAPAIDEAEYCDVMASLLYAQLAARKKHSAFSTPDKWQEVFEGGLQQFGWAPLLKDHDTRVADPEFQLADLLTAKDFPLTDRERLAGERLCNHLATLPKNDRALRILRRNIAWEGDDDEVDCGSGGTEREIDMLVDAWHEEQAAEQPSGARIWSPVNRPARPASRSAVVAAQLGVILPGRRVELLSIHFRTKERLGANLFDQRFSGSQVEGKIQVRIFAGDLDEIRYGQFRQRFLGLLGDHWAKEVVDPLPLSGVEL